MPSGQQIVKNAAWLVGATALNKVVAFASFYLIARLTGPAITGTYFYGVSVTSVFVVLSDIGMTPVLIRAFAGGQEDASRLFGAVIRLKALLAPLAIFLALAYGYFNHVDIPTMATIAIACLVMTADTFHLALYGTLRGKQNLKIEAVGMFVGQVLTACTAVLAALYHLGAPGLAAALLVGSLWNVLWALTSLRRLGIRLAQPLAQDYRRLIKEAVPFGISGIATKVYSYVDSLLLHAYYGATTVGEYAVAYKMTYALQFLPLAFSAALYPALSAAWAEKNQEALRKTVQSSIRILGVIGCICAALLSALAPEIVTIFYGTQYLGSIAPLEILPWVLLPIFMDFPIGSALNATHRAHLKTTAMVATMVVNVVLNAVLIPSLGAVGAAWASVFSFWFLFAVGVYFIQLEKVGWKTIFGIVARCLVLGAASWFIWRWIAGEMPFVASLVFGGIVAVGIAFALRLFTASDLQFVLQLRKRTVTDENVHGEG